MFNEPVSLPLRPCPSCGRTEWHIDYIRANDDGDEMRVDSCAACDWPPPSPMSPLEWRLHQDNELNKSHDPATELELRADALVQYGNSLPEGVTTEAFAEAANLRREAHALRSSSGSPPLSLRATRQAVETAQRNLAEYLSITAYADYDGETADALLRRAHLELQETIDIAKEDV